MANLATMQRYAEQCAEKLGVTDPVKLRWHGGKCVLRRKYHCAHCHVLSDEDFPRGTICIRPGTWKLATVKGRRMLIAHEVAHLATKSNHWTVTFARKMVLLGQADRYEQSLVKNASKRKPVTT